MTNIGSTFLPILAIYLIAAGMLILMLVQFFMIRKYKKLFKDLTEVFSKNQQIDYMTLVEKIIRSKQYNIPAPSRETVEMIFQYMQGLFDHSRVFIHVTNDKEIADKILHEGFKYSEDFYHSTEEVSPDLVDLTYKLQLYKHYGNYVVIMSIPKSLFDERKEKKINWSNDFLMEYGISEFNGSEELCYKLPPEYIKGYVDVEGKKIVNKKNFVS